MGIQPGNGGHTPLSIRDGVLECGEELQDKVAGQGGLTRHSSGMSTLTDRLVWPALLRKLDRQLPGYAA